MITILDYAINNLRSVEKAFLSLKVPVEVTDDPQKVRQARKLVLPGVGAFADAMANLKNRNLLQSVTEQVSSGKPLLGVCLGLQLLFSDSEELDIIQGLASFLVM